MRLLLGAGILRMNYRASWIFALLNRSDKTSWRRGSLDHGFAAHSGLQLEPAGRVATRSRYGCDSCDLDHEFGKSKIGNFHYCACRAIFRKILESYIRDVVESADVGDIDGDTDDIFHFRAVGP